MVNKWYIVLLGLVAVQAAGLTAMDKKTESPRNVLSRSAEIAKNVIAVNALRHSVEMRNEIAQTHSRSSAGSYYYNSSEPYQYGLRKDNMSVSMVPYLPLYL